MSNELNVQKFLRGTDEDGHKGSLQDLTDQYGIKIAYDADTDLVILNYHMIDSPRNHPIADECRGLTLSRQDFNVHAKSFHRFYNWGEFQSKMSDFNFNVFRTDSKEDGSLAILYYYKGWRLNTRGSFGAGVVQFSDLTWCELFCQAFGVDSLNDIAARVKAGGLNPTYSYSFELASPYNKIVRSYKKPEVFLLAAYNLNDFSEMDAPKLDDLAKMLGCKRPESYKFTSIGQVQRFLKKKGQEDPTFEGVVICDDAGRRWKIKTPEYLALHRMHGNGNVFNIKNIVPFILSGEEDELLAYFPEVEEKFGEAWGKYHWHLHRLQKIYEDAKDIEEQKEFALFVTKRTHLAPALFQARKTGKSVQEVLSSSPEFVTKFIFGKK